MDAAVDDDGAEGGVAGVPNGRTSDGAVGVGGDTGGSDGASEGGGDAGTGGASEGGRDAGDSGTSSDGGIDASRSLVWAWVNKTPSPSSSLAVGGYQMVYDRARQVTILFGGSGSYGGTPDGSDPSVLGDTWAWDGTRWRLETPNESPSPRSRYAIAYDSDRSVAVLFGGIDVDGSTLTDTWEWNGADWTMRASPSTSMTLSQPVMAYDDARKVMVLTGADQSGSLQTYVLKGDIWSSVTPGVSPPRPGTMIWDDARQTIVFITAKHCVNMGEGLTCDPNGTYAWDGSTWRDIGTSLDDEPGIMFYDTVAQLTSLVDSGGQLWQLGQRGWGRSGALKPTSGFYGPNLGSAYDQTRKTIVSYVRGAVYSQTLEWAGVDGIMFQSVSTSPPVNGPFQSAVAFSAAQGVVVDMPLNGPSTTPWAWDGQLWRMQSEVATWTSRPCHQTGFQDPAIASDPNTGAITVFAWCIDTSVSPNVKQPFTYEWDGVAWVNRTPVHVPPYRADATVWTGMARDWRRGVSVLFGGDASLGVPLQDTWEWDGVDWTNKTTGIAPPARVNPLLTYDSDRGVVVLVGGYAWDSQGNIIGMRDTWEWDGSMWVDRTTPDAPVPAGRGSFLYDPDRHVSVLVVPSIPTNSTGTWEWDGQAWQRTATTPALLFPYGMAYDSDRKAMVMVAPARRYDTTTTWEYQRIESP